MPSFPKVAANAKRNARVLIQQVFPLPPEARELWSAPDALTEFSLGLEQEMIFLRYRCGEPVGELAFPHHYNTRAGEYVSGVFDWLDFEVDVPEAPDGYDETEEEEFWDRCSSLCKSLTRVALGLALCELANDFEETAFFVYDDLDDPEWSGIPLYHELEDDEFDYAIKNLCGGDDALLRLLRDIDSLPVGEDVVATFSDLVG